MTSCPRKPRGSRRPTLLGPRSDMDQIAEAIRKIQAHAGALAKT